MQSLSISGSTTSINSASSSSSKKTKGKRIDVEAEYKKREAEKEHLNLVVIGHVDAGKSTLMGHLLYNIGEVSERTIKRYEKAAEKLRKSSFVYAWVLDETAEERERGITMDVAMTRFETKKRRFTLLDAPGHKDFIPRMISGAAQADVAILVVDSGPNEFETGFELGGQTREHALLVRSLGVAQMIVVINKMDVVNWSEERYQDIVSRLSPFLEQAGYRKSGLSFIPCSGYSGANLAALTPDSPLRSWYTGPTLLEQLDLFEVPQRQIQMPLRMAVADLFKGGSVQGASGSFTVGGRIDAGSIQVDEEILIMPIRELGVVKSIEMDSTPAQWAAAGDTAFVTINGIDFQRISKGTVLCSPTAPVPIVSKFRARIVTFNISIPLTPGMQFVLHLQSITEGAFLSKLVALVDKSSGEAVKKNPRAIPKNSSAVVEVQLNGGSRLCLETFKECKELGRFMLRLGSTTAAAGIGK
ncbi:P-loop containing nucleoside triphosphate hydrolase protein [Cladochytrium replicatum]|nr:P-loop containing nucleoside triphosphate hydrolase protein [Cladochytrium replicatum]